MQNCIRGDDGDVGRQYTLGQANTLTNPTNPTFVNMPNMRALLLALALTLSAHGASLRCRQQAPTDCKDVHLFLSRGAGDPYPGTQGPLIDAICGGLPSCDYEDVLYVGTFDAVCESVTTGVVNATAQITSYAERCPEAKLVLCGHSEVSWGIGWVSLRYRGVESLYGS